MSKKVFIIFLFSITILPVFVYGGIDINKIKKKFGKGETTLKKTIQVSFFYNEQDQDYQAKVAYRYDKLFIEQDKSEDLIQIAFNPYQEVKLNKAKYFRLDSLGEKLLIENVKVKYADTKDYFIENIFYNDLKVKQFKCSTTLPENYLLSYGYDIIFKDLKFLNLFNFQNSHEAVQNVEISITKNSAIDFSVFEFNYNDKIDKIENDNEIRYKANTLKRYKSNSSSVNGNYYLPHLIISVNSIGSSENKTEILGSTYNQYKWYNSLINELNPDTTYLRLLKSSFLKDGLSKEEKISAIFKWVQNNIQYVAFEDGIAGFKPAEADEVAKLKYGDCKGMTNLLVKLLQSEGFDANYAWIGTRSKNYNYSTPSLIVDNHMICALTHNDSKYYLDGTSKSATWSVPPPHIEGKEVLVANNNSFLIDTIRLSKPESNTISIIGNLDIQSYQPKVSLKIVMKGHFMRKYKSYLKYSSITDIKNIPYYFIKEYFEGINIESITEPIITNNNISYTVSGSYLNFSRDNDSITVFPFLNLVDYNFLEDQDAPVYIDFPYLINVDMKINNNKRETKERMYNSDHMGNKNYYGSFSSQKEDGNYSINQELYVNILHSPLLDHKIWNEFITKIKVFNNYPLTYAIDK